jgi:hypothetical protein
MGTVKQPLANCAVTLCITGTDFLLNAIALPHVETFTCINQNLTIGSRLCTVTVTLIYLLGGITEEQMEAFFTLFSLAGFVPPLLGTIILTYNNMMSTFKASLLSMIPVKGGEQGTVAGVFLTVIQVLKDNLPQGKFMHRLLPVWCRCVEVGLQEEEEGEERNWLEGSKLMPGANTSEEPAQKLTGNNNCLIDKQKAVFCSADLVHVHADQKQWHMQTMSMLKPAASIPHSSPEPPAGSPSLLMRLSTHRLLPTTIPPVAGSRLSPPQHSKNTKEQEDKDSKKTSCLGMFVSVKKARGSQGTSPMTERYQRAAPPSTYYLSASLSYVPTQQFEPSSPSTGHPLAFDTPQAPSPTPRDNESFRSSGLISSRKNANRDSQVFPVYLPEPGLSSPAAGWASPPVQVCRSTGHEVMDQASPSPGFSLPVVQALRTPPSHTKLVQASPSQGSLLPKLASPTFAKEATHLHTVPLQTFSPPRDAHPGIHVMQRPPIIGFSAGSPIMHATNSDPALRANTGFWA